MIIDASQADSTQGPYAPFSVRLALWEKVSRLQPHQSLRIDGMVTAAGHEMPARTIQINVAQITPEGWKIFTERAGDVLTVYRWS